MFIYTRTGVADVKKGDEINFTYGAIGKLFGKRTYRRVHIVTGGSLVLEPPGIFSIYIN